MFAVLCIGHKCQTVLIRYLVYQIPDKKQRETDWKVFELYFKNLLIMFAIMNIIVDSAFVERSMNGWKLYISY